MSMNRNDTLAQLSTGLRRFENTTAGQFLQSDWAGVNCLNRKDIEYFKFHADKPTGLVARDCMGRSMARTIDPLV